MDGTQARILNYKKPLDHGTLLHILDLFSTRYPSLGFGYLGESILGRGIPIVTLGQGEKEILYVGAHHGMEWITSMILSRFINEFCELAESKKSIYRTSLPLFCEQYTLYIIPMLNPDGVEYQIHGVSADNPLYQRLVKMNNGDDFSHWQANARGVDLNHNYDAGFLEYKKMEEDNGNFEGAPTKFSGEAPESEPEVGHLCNFIRFHERISLILSLHSQGEEIFYKSGGAIQRANAIARRISALTGYKISTPTGSASFGGLCDWSGTVLGIPSFTLECGRGSNPLPVESFFPIYASLREILFTVPKMI